MGATASLHKAPLLPSWQAGAVTSWPCTDTMLVRSLCAKDQAQALCLSHTGPSALATATAVQHGGLPAQTVPADTLLPAACTLLRSPGKYQPRCDNISDDTHCTISRVFANLPPDAAGRTPSSSSSGPASGHLDRTAAAQLANIHSNLLLAVHDVADHDNGPQLRPVAVFELAQQEEDVEWDEAVSILYDVAQASAQTQCGCQHVAASASAAGMRHTERSW